MAGKDCREGAEHGRYETMMKSSKGDRLSQDSGVKMQVEKEASESADSSVLVEPADEREYFRG